MPIERFERDGILHIVYSGTITPEEFAENIARLEEAEATTERVPNRLVDLTRVTRLEITFNDMLRLADRRRTLRFKNPFRIAQLAYDPVTTGFAEMYQALNDNPNTTIQVFFDRDAALRWLAESGRRDK
jgi:hypothetical protein